MSRVNKQGVRLLDPIGVNGHKRTRAQPCRHFASAGYSIIGRTFVACDYVVGESVEKEVLRKTCMHCGEVIEQ